jgi:hypothetical protein
LQSFRIANDRDLQKYCYHAAGTVGLMMSRLMSTQDSKADRHAIALGVAMQMTNIARDVREDAERTRSYLPGIANPLSADPESVRSAVANIIASSEIHYQVASEGFKYLRSDCRMAIRCASAMYREIGREILRNRYQVLHGRTIVGKSRLIWVLAVTTFGSFAQEFKNSAFDSVFSIYKSIQEYSMNVSKSSKPILQPSTFGQAKHTVYLGLSLTAIMATALFLMVFINPKDAAYSNLPLIYACGSMVGAIVFNRLAARCDVSNVASTESKQ